MSGFLPRNLLIVLKQVTRWSLFFDEKPFSGGSLSLRAQNRGVQEASEWFLADATGLGPVGDNAQAAIRRLGDYLRAHRFAPKPVEPECAAIEINRRELSGKVMEIINEAAMHSLILEIRTGRKDRNTGVFHQKYQLNPMLAPLFELPLTRRGTARLSVEECAILFSPETSDTEFAALRDDRLRSLTPPWRTPQRGASSSQRSLDI